MQSLLDKEIGFSNKKYSLCEFKVSSRMWMVGLYEAGKNQIAMIVLNKLSVCY
jgi:hypothetical protein